MNDGRAIAEVLQRTALSADGDYRERPEQAPPGPGESPGSDVFLCRVVKDGGVAGDAAADCTWTYEVTDLAGNTLKKDDAGNDAAAMTPVAPRQRFCEYWYAGEDRAPATSAYALAAYDGADLVLLTCFSEIPKEDTC